MKHRKIHIKNSFVLKIKKKNAWETKISLLTWISAFEIYNQLEV